jgi:translation initiation factor 3 subunit M
LKDLGLNEEETLTKMRLMSLGGIRNGGGEVSYKEICDKLKIDSKECEEWVVRGISSGLVDAKLDQVREVCIITRATQRVFGRNQWSELKNSLSNWSENLQSMKTLLSTSEDISTISAL